MVASLCAVTMLATSLASAVASPVYAEVIKKNATVRTNTLAQNYLSKSTSTSDATNGSSMSNTILGNIISTNTSTRFSNKYRWITNRTILPVLYSNWRATDIDSWYFYEDDGSVRTGWLYDNGWYYLSTEDEGTAGLMKYGWYQDSTGAWYFLNTIHDGTFGRAVSGWQWIDGYSYYFDSNCKLVTNGQTVDGYTVDSDGRWIVDEVVQFVEGKGLTSQIVYLDSSATSSDSSYTTSDDTSSNNTHSTNTQNSKYYTVTFDYRDGYTIETAQVAEGGFATEPETPYREGCYFLAWYENPTDLTNAFSFSTTPINENKTLYAVWLDVVNDSDGDGLLDGLEAVIGTDASKVDTDSDGLSDYDEYYYTHSNPLEAYSMVSTVLDALVDIDGDGLTNIEEIEFGSDPLYKDTDDDGLSDSEENEYGTNPNVADTDSDFDGLSDYHEERIRLFNGMEISLDKYDADTDGDELEDGVEVMFAKDRQGNTFFKMFSNPNIVDTDNDGIGDKEDSMALEPQSIDYLGSDRHLSAVSKRLEEKINNNLVLYSTDFTGTYKGKWGYEILMDDYYTFLEERNIETEGLYHGEYWLDEWDRYWDEYCTAFNEYVMSAGVVSKEAHYFRNNLNRIPNTLEEIINQADNWVLLNIASSEYHMYKTDFSGIGTYNLKFMSLDGRHEGVYINIYSPEHVENRGKACTQKTDPTNMGTYNYCGLYYNDANYIDEHAVLDVIPYYIHNNTKELGISGIFGTTIGRPILSNEHRYRVGFMAKDSRGRFEKIWTGQTQ